MTTRTARSRSALELEQSINDGDVTAMLEFLSLDREKLSKEELSRRYVLVWEADHGNDSRVLRMLGMVAAAAGESSRCRAHVDDFVASECYADAMHIALAMRLWGQRPEIEEGRRILLDLAHRGHIMSQVHLHYEKIKGKGFLPRLTFSIYRLAKLVQASILLLRNPDDPRART